MLDNLPSYQLVNETLYINHVNKEDKTFLRKLETCSGEVHHYLESFEAINQGHTSHGSVDNHKEESVHFNVTFLTACNKVYRQMSINPFATQLFQMVSSSKIFPQKIEDDCERFYKQGKYQYDDYVKLRLSVGAELNVMDKISKNKLKLPKDLTEVCVSSSPRIKLSPDLLSKLQEACDSRADAARSVFGTEFTNTPEALTDKDGKPFHNTKSDIINTIADSSNMFQGVDILSTVDSPLGLLVDLSMIIRAEANVICPVEYSYLQFAEHVLRTVEKMATQRNARRLDIVCDNYEIYRASRHLPVRLEGLRQR